MGSGDRWRGARRSRVRMAATRRRAGGDHARLEEEFGELREGAVGEDDVVARVEVVELLQRFVARLDHVDDVVGEVDLHLELVELAVFADDDAAEVGALDAVEIDFDGVGEEGAGERREGAELARGLLRSRRSCCAVRSMMRSACVLRARGRSWGRVRVVIGSGKRDAAQRLLALAMGSPVSAA